MVCLLFLHPYCVSCKILLLPNEGSTNNQASETSKRDPITTVVEKNVEVRPVKLSMISVVRSLLKVIQYGSRKVASHFMITNK